MRRRRRVLPTELGEEQPDARIEAAGFTAIRHSPGSVLDASDDSDDSLVFSCVSP